MFAAGYGFITYGDRARPCCFRFISDGDGIAFFGGGAIAESE